MPPGVLVIILWQNIKVAMLKRILVFILTVLLALLVHAQRHDPVVADSATHMPLPSASVFDRNGNALGMTDARGRLPFLWPDSYPVTVRYLGFRELQLTAAPGDTVFMVENIAELPELVIETRDHKVLHMLAYVREYSSLTSYTDTVFMFREKMVDYMIPSGRKAKFKGWRSPRILSCRSYYRFTNDAGLDSVSDRSRHHFSWSDWMRVAPTAGLPPSLIDADCATDTLFGKYSATEIWSKNNSRVMVDVDVLADTASRKWVPNLSGFFRDGLDFERFRVRFNYENVAGDSVAPQNLTGYSFNIESNGRGHDMFRFNRINQPVYVSTYAEVYIMDKEYITVKEARKWDKHDFSAQRIDIYEPPEAPDLQPAIRDLVARVNSLDRDSVRLDFSPDQRLVGIHLEDSRKNFGFGRRVLSMLKQLTGISQYRFHKSVNQNWDDMKDDFRRQRRQKDKER